MESTAARTAKNSRFYAQDKQWVLCIFLFDKIAFQIPEQARAAPRAQDPDVKFDELWKVKIIYFLYRFSCTSQFISFILTENVVFPNNQSQQ